MNTRPTPETDTNADDAHNVCLYYDCQGINDNLPAPIVVCADFARKLERERDEARAALKTGGMLNIIDRAAHERAAAIRERDEARAETIRWQSIAEGRGRTDDEVENDTQSELAAWELLREAQAENIGWQNKWQVAVEMAALAQNELAAVTAQRDELQQWKNDQMTVNSEWDMQTVGELLGLRIGEAITLNIEPQIRELINQRDRLAEALQKVSRSWNYGEVAQQALQSLTNPNEEP
jgi:hypothetical protein